MLNQNEFFAMSYSFFRYSATGNTFLIADNRSREKINEPNIVSLCRNAKVDGLIFLENSTNSNADFHMKFFNNDGNEVEMCGNGARSIVHFAKFVLKIESQNGSFSFTTKNALYQGNISSSLGEAENLVEVQVKMNEIRDWGLFDVSDLYPSKESYFLNTGVPHCVYLVENLEDVPLTKAGTAIRFHERFPEGTNINWVEVLHKQKIRIRTYERGVDGETDSCGTGATASALTVAKFRNWESPILVHVNGGQLTVRFSDDFSEVFLQGPVDFLGEYPSEK